MDDEAAICDNRTLWSLDGAMRTADDRARSDSPNNARYVGKQQKSWLQFPNACGYDVKCLRDRYNDQLGWLEGCFGDSIGSVAAKETTVTKYLYLRAS